MDEEKAHKASTSKVMTIFAEQLQPCNDDLDIGSLLGSDCFSVMKPEQDVVREAHEPTLWRPAWIGELLAE